MGKVVRVKCEIPVIAVYFSPVCKLPVDIGILITWKGDQRIIKRIIKRIINALLWFIKHLVYINPLSSPNCGRLCAPSPGGMRCQFILSPLEEIRKGVNYTEE